jgi:hypothetical protein
MGGGYERDPSTVEKVAAFLGYSSIYGLPANRYEKLCKQLNLDDLETEARKAVEDFAKNADDFNRSAVEHGTACHYDNKFLNKIDGLSETCNNLVTSTKTQCKTEMWRELFRDFDVKLPQAPNFVDEFKKRYPLLSHVDLYYTDMDDVVDYINLKENN